MSRSDNMAAVRARDTVPELALRKALWAAGMRGFRVHMKVPGHPDIAFTRRRVAVFVDGCYWHGCPEHYSSPRTHVDFWAKKLRENVARDRASDIALLADGWVPVHLWVHELKNLDRAVAAIRAQMERVVGAQGISDRRTDPYLAPWYVCQCGSVDVQVVAVAGHGSLKPNAEYPIASATVSCRICGLESERHVTHHLHSRRA